MKKLFIISLMLIALLTGCGQKKENKLKEVWSLDESLKPSLKFERSKKNDSYGIFYIDSQIKFEDFITYIKKLEEKKFTVDWRYSDVNSIKKLEESYSNKESEDSIFKDGYINFRMCQEKNEDNNQTCFFMQWVDKEQYNLLNKDNPTSYSFKLETEKIGENETETKTEQK